MNQGYRTAREPSARFVAPDHARRARSPGASVSGVPGITGADVFERLVDERDEALARERALRQELEVLKAELGIQQSHGASRRL